MAKDKEKSLRWRRANIEKHRAYMKEWIAKHPQAHKQYHLKKLYGLSLEDYWKMHEFQGGVCRICKNPETVKNKAGKVYDLAVDHDKFTNKIRGLLCSRCNQGIGYFLHEILKLESAISYLKESI